MGDWATPFRSFSLTSISDAVMSVESRLERAIGIPDEMVEKPIDEVLSSEQESEQEGAGPSDGRAHDVAPDDVEGESGGAVVGEAECGSPVLEGPPDDEWGSEWDNADEWSTLHSQARRERKGRMRELSTRPVASAPVVAAPKGVRDARDERKEVVEGSPGGGGPTASSPRCHGAVSPQPAGVQDDTGEDAAEREGTPTAQPGSGEDVGGRGHAERENRRAALSDSERSAASDDVPVHANDAEEVAHADSPLGVNACPSKEDEDATSSQIFDRGDVETTHDAETTRDDDTTRDCDGPQPEPPAVLVTSRRESDQDNAHDWREQRETLHDDAKHEQDSMIEGDARELAMGGSSISTEVGKEAGDDCVVSTPGSEGREGSDEVLRERISELEERLEARERQLLGTNESLSRMKQEYDEVESALAVANSDLASAKQRSMELEEQMSRRAKSGADGDHIGELKLEFSKRLGEMEKKLMNVTRERDRLKDDIRTDTTKGDLEKKQEEVTQLREEGEKLQAKLFQYEGLLKKVRAESKEMETDLAAKTSRVESMEQLLESKVTRLKEVEKNEKQLEDTIANMKQVAESTARKLDNANRQLSTSQTQVTELRVALEKSWAELADQRKISEGSDSKADIRVMELRESLSREHEAELKKLHAEAAAREKGLHQTIRDLRTQVSRMEERAGWREDELRKEIEELKLRCQSAEQRNEEVAASVAESTKPLARQLEVLQQSHQAKQEVWESVEKTLQGRLKDEEERANVAEESERQASMEAARLVQQVKQLESAVASEREHRNRLASEIAAIRGQLDDAERAKVTAEATTRELQTRVAKLRESQQATELRMTEQLESARARERELLEEKQSLLQQLDARKLVVPRHDTADDKKIERTCSTRVAVPGSREANPLVYDQIAVLEASKAALEDELVKLTTLNEQLVEQVAALQKGQSELAELRFRHNTALEIIGEREEQLESLQGDFLDLKTLYRTQVSELLGRIEQLQKEPSE